VLALKASDDIPDAPVSIRFIFVTVFSVHMMRNGPPKENYFNPGDQENTMARALRAEPELWDLFSRREEYSPPFLDRHQRFGYYLSSNRDIMDPKVSRFLIEKGFETQYPDNKPFALCLTHDIDYVNYKVLRAANLYVDGKYTANQAMKMAFNKVSKRCNYLWNFKSTMDLEEKYGGKSTFFFMALEKGEIDHTYNIGKLKNEMRAINERGWEVGLHGGHDAYRDASKLKKEKGALESVLGRKVIGYRNHYLKFKVPDTWSTLKNAGFKYDSSLGYPGHVGYRNGMCHPFKPHDLNAKRTIDILELPLNIMDATFDEYMKTDMSTSWELSKRLIDITHRHRGVLTIVWHNSSMMNEWLELYEKILKYSHEKGAWITSGEEIYRNAVGESSG